MSDLSPLSACKADITIQGRQVRLGPDSDIEVAGFGRNHLPLRPWVLTRPARAPVHGTLARNRGAQQELCHGRTKGRTR